MDIGTLLLSVRTGGTAIIEQVRESDYMFTLDGIAYSSTKEYYVYGRRTGRAIWLKEHDLIRHMDNGTLIEWDELKPKEFIPRYNFVEV